MKRLSLFVGLLMALVMQARLISAQATCGTSCGGFSSTAVQLCLGESVTFTTSYTSGVTWSATSGKLSITASSAGSVTVQGIGSGSGYLCLAYNANGTVCAVCKPFTIVSPPSGATVLGFAYDPSLNLVKATASPSSSSYYYKWYIGGVAVTGWVLGNFQYAMGGSCQQQIDISVEIASIPGCGSMSSCKRFYLECYDNYLVDLVDDDPDNNVVVTLGACTGGGDPPEEMLMAEPSGRIKQKETHIYPNPASESVHLTFEDSSTRTLEVVDKNGKVIYSKIISSKEYSIDISEFKKGQYFIRQRKSSGSEGFVSRLLID